MSGRYYDANYIKWVNNHNNHKKNNHKKRNKFHYNTTPFNLRDILKSAERTSKERNIIHNDIINNYSLKQHQNRLRFIIIEDKTHRNTLATIGNLKSAVVYREHSKIRKHYYYLNLKFQDTPDHSLLKLYQFNKLRPFLVKIPGIVNQKSVIRINQGDAAYGYMYMYYPDQYDSFKRHMTKGLDEAIKLPDINLMEKSYVHRDYDTFLIEALDSIDNLKKRSF
jgi:hypothetical protein